MTPATQKQIEEACMTRSGDDAWTYLKAQGLSCTRSQCHKALALMLEDGRRTKLKGGGQGVVGEAVDAFDARMGCERMLTALACAFAAKSDRLGISFEQAMATSLGNVAARA